MIVNFKRGKGEVFHAGSCEWVAGLLRRDAIVEKVTANVLDRYVGQDEGDLSMNRHAIEPGNAERRPSNLFYVTRLRRPLIDRAEGIYIWDIDGRRYIDGCSGAINVNLGHGNRTCSTR